MESEGEASNSSGVRLLEDEDFVWSRVWPLVSGRASRPAGAELDVAVHRRRDDGRAVAEYVFEGSLRAFAKLYPDDSEGRAVFRIHDEFCKNGFGPPSVNRVPEPLGYFPEHGVLVVRAAHGECLGVTLRRDWSAFEDGVARSARWLAALHTSSLAVGPREQVADGASRLAQRVEKAAALRPDLGRMLTSTVAELASRYGTAPGSSALVQTHGRFHGGHVFMTDESVTAIDLDRAAVADPAKDVGEFVSSLSSIRALGLADDRRVDAGCESFLGEYVRHAARIPDELTYYWSYCTVWALVRQAFKDRPERRRWKERVEYLQREFDAVPERAAAWLP